MRQADEFQIHDGKAASGWRWVWACGISGYNPPPPETLTATGRATDAPLFLQRLFKGLIDRTGLGGGGVGGAGLRGGEAGAQRGMDLLFNAEGIKAMRSGAVVCFDLW